MSRYGGDGNGYGSYDGSWSDNRSGYYGRDRDSQYDDRSGSRERRWEESEWNTASEGQCGWQHGDSSDARSEWWSHRGEYDAGTDGWSSSAPAAKAGSKSKNKKGRQTVRAGDWVCASCDFHNFASKLFCMSCRKPKPAPKRDADGKTKADLNRRLGELRESRNKINCGIMEVEEALEAMEDGGSKKAKLTPAPGERIGEKIRQSELSELIADQVSKAMVACQSSVAKQVTETMSGGNEVQVIAPPVVESHKKPEGDNAGSHKKADDDTSRDRKKVGDATPASEEVWWDGRLANGDRVMRSPSQLPNYTTTESEESSELSPSSSEVTVVHFSAGAKSGAKDADSRMVSKDADKKTVTKESNEVDKDAGKKTVARESTEEVKKSDVVDARNLSRSRVPSPQRNKKAQDHKSDEKVVSSKSQGVSSDSQLAGGAPVGGRPVVGVGGGRSGSVLEKERPKVGSGRGASRNAPAYVTNPKEKKDETRRAAYGWLQLAGMEGDIHPCDRLKKRFTQDDHMKSPMMFFCRVKKVWRKERFDGDDGSVASDVKYTDIKSAQMAKARDAKKAKADGVDDITAPPPKTLVAMAASRSRGSSSSGAPRGSTGITLKPSEQSKPKSRLSGGKKKDVAQKPVKDIWVDPSQRKEKMYY